MTFEEFEKADARKLRELAMNNGRLHQKVIGVLRTLWVACLVSFSLAVSGSATDREGAAIAGANAVATELRSGAGSDCVSEESEAISKPFLQPGTLEVTVVYENLEENQNGAPRTRHCGYPKSIARPGDIKIHKNRLESGLVLDAVQIAKRKKLDIKGSGSTISSVPHINLKL